MPQKTIYIRDEDLDVWDRAARVSEGSVASVLADALRAYLDRRAAVTEEDVPGGAAISAPHGEKMIQLDIRLFTDDIAGPGKIVPKHAWDTGMVTVQTNLSHGLKKGNPIPFNSLLDLPGSIEQVLIRQGIILHSGSRSRKYLRSNAPKGPRPIRRQA